MSSEPLHTNTHAHANDNVNNNNDNVDRPLPRNNPGKANAQNYTSSDITTNGGYRTNVPMEVQAARPEDLQASYASIVGNDPQPKGFYGGMGEWPFLFTHHPPTYSSISSDKSHVLSSDTPPVNVFGAVIGTLGAIPCCICCPNPYKEVLQGNVGLVTKFGRFYKAVDRKLCPPHPRHQSP